MTTVPVAPDSGVLDQRFLGKLRCPICRTPVAADRLETSVQCSGDRHRFAVTDGIPVFLPEEYLDLGKIVEDVQRNLVDHLNWKRMQIRHMDVENRDPQIRELETVRPYGYGRFYAWLHLHELELARRLYAGAFDGKEVLSVCAGRGMDAEFFGHHGARVACADISLSSLGICRERFRRQRGAVNAVCCDAECLPFTDGSFDVCYVYDGLHHLPNPYQAIAEMIRVARESIIIIEPNASWLVALTMRLGVTTRFEESGNFKHYFSRRELRRFLMASGMRRMTAEFALVKKRHYPSRLLEWLGTWPVYELLVAGLGVASGMAGRWGNRCIVVGQK